MRGTRHDVDLETDRRVPDRDVLVRCVTGARYLEPLGVARRAVAIHHVAANDHRVARAGSITGDVKAGSVRGGNVPLHLHLLRR
jgi:hypothetical protein